MLISGASTPCIQSTWSDNLLEREALPRPTRKHFWLPAASILQNTGPTSGWLVYGGSKGQLLGKQHYYNRHGQREQGVTEA